jgi:betaine-aldehyde dehydrogenase
MGMMWKVAPALACGNAMIFKPSECTPITAPHIAHLFRDVLPPSLLQVLVGSGSVAETLLSHPDIHKVSVTGSLETGKAVARQATSTFKRVTLELGGKSPLLVFRDADMDSASRVAIDGNFVNNGEVCSNCTRIYAENTCIDEFVDRVLTHLETLPLQTGDNMDPVIKMGPLMMNPFHPTQHFDRVKGLIDRAKKDPNVGLLWGGNCFQSSQGAFFCEPTVFVAYSDEAEICQTEVFGPVMTVLAFDTEQEAITRANASIYGLAAGVMTRDLARAHRVAKQLQAGTVWINNWNLTPLEVGFGPYKQSGYGKELGMQALECYSQVKSVYVEMGAVRDFEE